MEDRVKAGLRNAAAKGPGRADRGSFESGRVACAASYDLGFWLGEVDHRCPLTAAGAGVENRVHDVVQPLGADPPVGHRLVLARQHEAALDQPEVLGGPSPAADPAA